MLNRATKSFLGQQIQLEALTEDALFREQGAAGQRPRTHVCPIAHSAMTYGFGLCQTFAGWNQLGSLQRSEVKRRGSFFRIRGSPTHDHRHVSRRHSYPILARYITSCGPKLDSQLSKLGPILIPLGTGGKNHFSSCSKGNCQFGVCNVN